MYVDYDLPAKAEKRRAAHNSVNNVSIDSVIVTSCDSSIRQYYVVLTSRSEPVSFLKVESFVRSTTAGRFVLVRMCTILKVLYALRFA